MKIVGIIVLSVVLILLGVKIFQFAAQQGDLNKSIADIETRLMKAKSDEADLAAEQQYLANPINLQKELRARFNYKKPGEKMIIIVPQQSTSTTSTAR